MGSIDRAEDRLGLAPPRGVSDHVLAFQECRPDRAPCTGAVGSAPHFILRRYAPCGEALGDGPPNFLAGSLAFLDDSVRRTVTRADPYVTASTPIQQMRWISSREIEGSGDGA